jgi:hypothetical protein
VCADRSTLEDSKAIVDLESLGIKELAALRDDVTEKLAKKVAVRHWKCSNLVFNRDVL